MILDAGETNFVGPTTIISLSEDVPELVREGTGSLAPFGL
jgi:tRNA A37 threonylcarbamoyladenosine synthetase subunit TsaC/SUA5/YrdC